MSSSVASERFELERHEASRAQGVRNASVSLRRVSAQRLRLHYRLRGDSQSIVWPETAGTVLRLDNLWRATCCEAFVRSRAATGYREWNFSPAGHWQSYDFDARRTGQKLADVALPALDLGDAHARPNVAGVTSLTDWSLVAEFDVAAGNLELGLTLVVADRQGRLDYWALAHNSATPDFHDPDTWRARV